MYDLFLISPYTHKDPDVVRGRVEATEKYIGYLINQNVVAYSAIAANDHLLDKYNVPSSYDFWQEHCVRMMSCARDVYVLCLPGWEASVGVQDEIKKAKELNKPITYIRDYDVN